MMLRIVDLIEPDNGCEGYLPGEEPMATLILEDGRSVRVPDMLAYKMGWDAGGTVSSEDIQKFTEEV